MRSRLTTIRVVFVALLAVFSAAGVFAQQQQKANAVEFDISSFGNAIVQIATDAQGTVPIPYIFSYQRTLFPHVAAGAVLNIAYAPESSDSGSILQMEPGVLVAWHPFRTDLRGIYLGPYVSYDYVADGAFGSNPAEYFYSLRPGAVFGYELPLADFLMLDLWAPVQAAVDLTDPSSISLYGDIRLSVGVAF